MKKNNTIKKRKLKLCFLGTASNVHTQRPVNYFVNLGYEVHLVDHHPYTYKNLKFHLIRNFTGIKFVDYLLRIAQSIRIIRKIKPDLLHSFEVTYPGLIGALSGLHPFVLTPLGSDILFVPEKSFIHNAITKFTIFKADVIHCIDVSVLNRLKQLYGNKIKEKDSFILNEGVNTSTFGPVKRKPGNHINILCLRVLRDTYSPLHLVEALNILVNGRNQHNLRAIMLRRGQKPYKKLVYERVKEYGLTKYIRFHDWVNHKTPYYMRMADIYVDTIYRPVQGQGTGKTMLEAMSSGLAVVAPDNPSIELYVKHKFNGLIYKGANPESLANAIQSYIESKKLMLKMGKNARKFILGNFDQRKNMKLMEEEYSKIIKKYENA